MKNNVFQIMHGFCIIAVVLSHILDKKLTNPNLDTAMVIQNLANYAVTGFAFLAGYFIKIEEVLSNTKKFIIRKSQRVLIPYFLWSIFYVLFNIVLFKKDYTVEGLIKTFLLGTASSQLYFCLLCFLFILLVHFVVKRMENKMWNIIFYLATPICFAVIYHLLINYQIYNHSIWRLIPFTAFFYFYVGLKWRNLSIKLNTPSLVLLICLGYLIELVETYYLFSVTNDPSFSAKRFKYSTILYAIPIILLFLKLKNINLLKNNILIALGNNSFGIFLSHMAVLRCVKGVADKIYNTIQYNTYSML